MRANPVFLILVVVSASAIAQQHVVSNRLDPKNRANGPYGGSCAAVPLAVIADKFTVPPPGDPCDVTVYNTDETTAHIAEAKKAAVAECKQVIETAKADLAKDINHLPSAAVEALKSQIKEEIKAEVIKELINDIKAGKLVLAAEPKSR